VFARDTANNYLDAYIYGLGGNGSSTVTTIINTVTNTLNNSLVPTNIVDRELLKEREVIYRDREIIKEVAGLTPPEIIEKVIYLYKANPNPEQKQEIVNNVNAALLDLDKKEREEKEKREQQIKILELTNKKTDIKNNITWMIMGIFTGVILYFLSRLNKNKVATYYKEIILNKK
jgi:hypothetical protein